MLRWERILFYLLVVVALSIIVIPRYYITGDGASHTYNAKVLFDYIFNHERDFYKSFYILNRCIDTNWTSHIFIGLLLQFFPPWLADKFFQIFYVIAFAFGFRYLIRSVAYNNAFLSFLFFPFLFSLPFQQGFYNYCLSLAFMFFAVGYYIRNRTRLHEPFYQLVCALLLLITAFTHGMPALYGIFIIFFIWFAEHRSLWLPLDIKKLSAYLSQFTLIFLPTLLLIFLFLSKRGFGTVPHAWSKWEKLVAFFKMWTSQSTRHHEIYPAVLSLILIFIYLIILAFARISVHIRTQVAIGWVFLFISGFTFFSYITCPHSVGGAGSIDIRLSYLPPLFLLLFFASKNWTNLTKKIFIITSFAISATFLFIRFPYVLKANTVAKEIMKVTEHIADKSVVLNLHFDDWQKLNEHDRIFHKDNSFIHFSDYVGAYKNMHLILLMNYEAEINYFPVNWAAGMNPRNSIPDMLPGNYPPCGNFLDYEKQTGKKIDYILLQNWHKDMEQHTCVQQLIAQLNQYFYLHYASEHNYVLLLKRKTETIENIQ